MRASDDLRRTIDACAPYWAAEAEVVRTYWDSPRRSRETDLLRLRRQAYKEIWDGFHPMLERLASSAWRAECEGDRRRALDLARSACDELAHFRWFAGIHDSLRAEGQPALTPDSLRADGNWPENEALNRLRRRHEEEHGGLGMRVRQFTEGGYMTLYAEAMKLEGRGGADGRVAEACGRVYEDEFEHMLAGIAGLDDEGLSPSEWQLFADLTVEQLRCRIPMRNAQFSRPVSGSRLAELCQGCCSPLAFDYRKAGLEGDRMRRGEPTDWKAGACLPRPSTRPPKPLFTLC
jgi:hypothetical protein